MKVALFGSTGLIGKNVLKLLVRLDQVERVYCPVRRVPEFLIIGFFVSLNDASVLCLIWLKLMN